MKTKRILYLFASYPRWSEGFLRQDLGGLLARGLPIVAASLFPGDCCVQPGWPSVKCLADQRPSPEAKNLNLARFLPRRFRGVLTLMRHHRLFNRFLALCREEHIAHIHGEFADIAGLFAARAAVKLGCTYSVGLHADDCLNMKYTPSSILKNALFATVCNEAAQKAILAMGAIDADRLHLCRHGVDLTFWKYNAALHRSSGFDMLFAGRLVPKKGLDILMETLAGLPGEYTLKIAGSGPDECRLHALSEKLGISSRVTWLGSVSQDALRSLFASSSCLCVPSVDGRDGMDGIPNVILEAMASGLPLVAFCSGGICEVLDKNTGFPVEECSARALGDAIVFMAMHEQELECRRRQARHRVEQEHDSKKMSAKRASYFMEI